MMSRPNLQMGQLTNRRLPPLLGEARPRCRQLAGEKFLLGIARLGNSVRTAVPALGTDVEYHWCDRRAAGIAADGEERGRAAARDRSPP